MTEHSNKPSPDRRRRSGNAERRPRGSRSGATQKAPAPGDPRILDAVRDQHGVPWIRYGSETGAIWFGVTELISAPTAVFKALARAGVTYVHRTAQDAFRLQIQEHMAYREALVASRPGWLGKHYAFGDGTMISPKGKGEEVIIAFEPNPKFAPRGCLRTWLKAVEPSVRHQPLPYFAVAFALAGPLLHFLSRGQLNPIVEVVGKRETGKSTVGVLAASVWAGDADSDVGGGESWHLTLNAIDDLKSGHRDGFLFLDEGNLVGVPGGKLPEFLQDAIFTLSSNRGKRRMGDPGASETANVATLSTTNTPLRELVGGNDARRAALESRLITLTLPSDHPHGVFETVPEGYGSSREASEALQKAADACWGAPAREFIGKLSRRAARDEDQLRRRVAKRIVRAMNDLPNLSGSARVQKTFALVTVAAGLAQEWGVIPKRWGSPTMMVQAVAKLAGDVQQKSTRLPIERVRAYADHNRAELVDADRMKKRMSKAAFEACPGFLRVRDGRTELLVPGRRFRNEFPDHKAIIDALHRDRVAQTEEGRQKKHTIKAPRAICADGRIYCITLE